jgi:para-nitrobenzyl esterase
LLLSPLAEGLFHRAVMESGPVVGVPMMPLPAAAEAGVAAVAQLKLDNIAALRAVPPAEVNKAKSFGTAFPNLDGKVVVANPDQLESPVRNRVPVIAGYNRDEISSADAPQTVEALKKEVQQRFGELAPRVLQLYPHGNDAEAAQSGAQLNRDRCLASLLLWAEQRAAQGQVVYAYSFERALPAGDPVRFGAFHSAELPYVFGTLDMPGVAATAADRSISTEMQDRWLAFMRSGDPNPKRVAAKWQRANSDVSSIWRIGAGHGASFITADRLAVFREYAAKGGRLGLF